MLAGSIDLALVILIASLLTLPAYVLNYEHSLWPDIVMIATAVSVYFVGSEYFWQATPGKWLVGLQVVTLGGKPASLTPVIVRNALRVIDGLPGFYFVGLLAIGVTGRAQRVGDLAAGTTVRLRSSRDHFSQFLPRATITAFATVLTIATFFAVRAIDVQLYGNGSPDGAAWIAGLVFVTGVASLGLRQPETAKLLTVVLYSATLTIGIGAYASRYSLAADNIDAIETDLSRTLPLGSSEGAVLEHLSTSGIDHSSPEMLTASRAAWFQGESVAQAGDSLVIAKYYGAGWRLLCPITLDAMFIIRESKLVEIYYLAWGDGCP